MDKRAFFKKFNIEDSNLLAALYEDIELCQKIDYPVFTNLFYPPQVWSRICDMEKALGLKIQNKGLTYDSEKRMILIKPFDFDAHEEQYPAVYFKIETNSKFSEFEHKHFLGSIMNLGIKREVLGDLIVKNSTCYGIITEDLYDFFKSNLTKINKVSITITTIEADEVPPIEFKEKSLTVSSTRLDNIVAAYTGRSRSAAVDMIDEGLVTLNYSVKRDKSISLKEGDLLTIKKYGKLIFQEITGESKKGKQRILLKIYS